MAGRRLPREDFFCIGAAQGRGQGSEFRVQENRNSRDSLCARRAQLQGSATAPPQWQKKPSAPRPADGGHDTDCFGAGLPDFSGGATSDGRRSGFRVQGSGKIGTAGAEEKFSTVWKSFFHGVENFCGNGRRRSSFFHGVENFFAAVLAKPRSLVRLRRPL